MPTIRSAQTGYWDVGATWVGGHVPLATDQVDILSAHKVTLRDQRAVGAGLNVYGYLGVVCGGWLDVSAAVFVDGGTCALKQVGSGNPPRLQVSANGLCGVVAGAWLYLQAGLLEVQDAGTLGLSGGSLGLRGGSLYVLDSGSLLLEAGAVLAHDRGEFQLGTQGHLNCDGTVVIRFSRRERTIIGFDQHAVLDFQGAYGFAGPGPRWVGACR